MAGLRAMYIIPTSDILYQATDGTGAVTNFTLATGKKFYKYDLQRETSQFVEDVRSVWQTGSTIVNQEVRLVINERNQALVMEIMRLAYNTVTILCEDTRGARWVLGQTLGLDLESAKGGSGLEAGDRRGFELIFKGWEKNLAPAFNFSSGACPEGPFGPEFSLEFPGGTLPGGCGGTTFEDLYTYGAGGTVGDFIAADFTPGEFEPLT